MSLGFRPPQFSEDVAWLPAWLNQLHVETLSDRIGESQNYCNQAFKDLNFLHENNSGGNGWSELLSKGGGYNNCRLFLSGEDSSPICSDPSSANVLDFHLHLPSKDDSQNISSSQQEIFQSKVLKSNKAVDGDQISAEPTKKASQVEGRAKKHQKKCDTGARHLKAADINDAIQLSIAASEALVIHELVKSESPSTPPTSEAVVEVALKVLQARLEVSEDSIHCQTEEIDDINCLSDLYDFTVEDVIEDVGLCANIPDNLHNSGILLSRVGDTQDHYGGDRKFSSILPQGQEVHSHENATEVQSESMDKLVQLYSDVMFTAQRTDLGTIGLASLQPQANANSSLQARDLENAEKEEKVVSEVPMRFDSHWLGGWTEKELEASSQTKIRSIKIFPKFFAAETSVLSESALGASDEYSLVQANKTRSKTASQSIMPSNGTCNKSNEEISLSQDLVKASSLSTFDPLCSVVPCSISSENNEFHNGGNFIIPTSVCWKDNLLRNSDSPPIYDNGKRAVHINSVEGSKTTILKQSTYLTNYSMLLPTDDMRFFSCGKNYCPIVTSRKFGSNYGNDILMDSITLLTSEKRNYKEAEIVGTSEDHVNSFPGENQQQDAVPPESKAKLPFGYNVKVYDVQVPGRKRVQFSEAEVKPHSNKRHKLKSTHRKNSSSKASKKGFKISKHRTDIKVHQPIFRKNGGNRLIFSGIQFLITGFSSDKEKEIEELIIKYGGIILPDIPSHSNWRRRRSSRSNYQYLPVVLCLEKVQTIKFLYGCAVNGFVLNVKWLTDSIAATAVLPPEKYMIITNQLDGKQCTIGKPVRGRSFIFERVGIMLHGNPGFCTNLEKIIKHGGGTVFKTLHWLVHSLESRKISLGAIVVEDQSRTSRLLRNYALEKKITMLSASWIILSLHTGKVLPFPETRNASPSLATKILEFPSMELSEEF